MEHLIIGSRCCPDSFVQLSKDPGLILPAGDAEEINGDSSIYAKSQPHSRIYEDHKSLEKASYKCQGVRTVSLLTWFRWREKGPCFSSHQSHSGADALNELARPRWLISQIYSRRRGTHMIIRRKINIKLQSEAQFNLSCSKQLAKWRFFWLP